MNPSYAGLGMPRRESLRSMLAMIHADGGRLTYRCLLAVWRKGLRNGGWSRLDVGAKALVRCALWVARIRGSICNMRLMVQVLSVLLRLVRNCRSRIVDAGNRRAHAMLQAYAEGPKNVFSWAPQLREWLWDAGYIRYLGLLEVNR
jgi:hypothetical protein